MKIKSLSDIPSVADYLRRIGAEERSLRTAVVKERAGAYWHDVAIIRFHQNGLVDAPEAYAPTEQEQKQILDECGRITWPQIKLINRTVNLPPEIANAPPENVFEFRNKDGAIIMLQLRRELRGNKSYLPFTYWDDDEWRQMEPDGKLPLWGQDQLAEHATVFIHEGAKAARAVRDMVAGRTPAMRAKLRAHPWGAELSNAAHVGWIGGALSPARTDWRVLKDAGITRAYIVSDNDAAGLSAVAHIAFNLRMPTFHVQFTNEWPVSFDLADEFPDNMFRTEEGVRNYIGPSFRSCLHPATWATDQIPNKRGKPTLVLRKSFEDSWVYVEEADLFVCVEMPDLVRSEVVMNKMLSAFSHTQRTSDLLIKSYHGRSARICYRPDIAGRIVTATNTSAINLHTPTHVKPNSGSAEKFLAFMTYMFPNPQERREVLRWCATLIARPDVRMEYGLLLASETQGIGKSTLGSYILAPLVGQHNTGWPTEASIVQSDFNGWLAHKRLIVINEIYSGHSWKAYNRLKSIITDREVEVNQKFQRTYVIENWAHIFACSNSSKALRVEDDDRRWFYPEVTEDKWPRDKFVELNAWLQGGGLGAILSWAQSWDDYVLPGQPAPMTVRKRQLIIESRSDGQKEATRLAETIAERQEPIAVTMKSVVSWVRSCTQSKVFDSDAELRKVMRENGVTWFVERVKAGGLLQYVGCNAALITKLRDEGFNISIVKRNATVVEAPLIFNGPDGVEPKRATLGAALSKLIIAAGDVLPAEL